MMDIINFNTIQQSFQIDILVVGGGSAGCLAADGKDEEQADGIAAIETIILMKQFFQRIKTFFVNL